MNTTIKETWTWSYGNPYPPPGTRVKVLRTHGEFAEWFHDRTGTISNPSTSLADTVIAIRMDGYNYEGTGGYHEVERPILEIMSKRSCSGSCNKCSENSPVGMGNAKYNEEEIPRPTDELEVGREVIIIPTGKEGIIEKKTFHMYGIKLSGEETITYFYPRHIEAKPQKE